MNEKNIEVQMDTNVINDNTADAVNVILTHETPIQGDYVVGDTTIKGSGLVQVIKESVNLGRLKQKKAENLAVIEQLTNENTEIDAKIALVQPAVDAKIMEVQTNNLEATK